MRWLDGIIDSMDVSEQTLRNSEGQGSLACCSPWSCKESDMPERLNHYSKTLFYHFKNMCLNVQRTLKL